MRTYKMNGMTMVELVIAIVVLSMLMLVAGSYLTRTVKAYNSSIESIASYNKLRLLSERLIKEIRSTNFDGSNFTINNASASQFDFDDVNGNQIILNYDAASSQLEIYYATPNVTAILAQGISGFSFTFYKADGFSLPASNAEIIFVEYDITLLENGINYRSKSRLSFRDAL